MPSAIGGRSHKPDVAEVVRAVFHDLPDFPHLPELPERGAGADMIGRAAALLVDLPAEVYAGRWQLTARPGVDARRARDFLQRDLDALTAVASDHDGPVKIAAAGPWTLATQLSRAAGGPLLRDAGAVRELAASLREGLKAYVAEVAARLPAAQVVLQLDEPSLPAVLAGHVPTESGLGRLAAAEPQTVRQALAGVVEDANAPVVVHCCAPNVPVALIRSSGAAGVCMDMSLLDFDAAQTLDPLGEALESGMWLAAGTVPAVPTEDSTPTGRAAAQPVELLWQRLGLDVDRQPEQVVVTPTCGLAGADAEYARAALTACRDAARRLGQ